MVCIRVLLVDDNDAVRRGLEVFLDTCDDIEVVGAASNGNDAVSICQMLLPDVLVMDVSLGKEDGIDLAARICGEYPQIRALILSGFLDEALLRRALAVGIRGYLEKNIPVDVLSDAIRSIYVGEFVFGPTAQEIYKRIRPDSIDDMPQ
ncbi:MAG: hypothetical protein CL610_17340 [Anaerolineaceae bacterium]|nr:hypothetical protein [Anaerolineaceae bacterium]